MTVEKLWIIFTIAINLYDFFLLYQNIIDWEIAKKNVPIGIRNIVLIEILFGRKLVIFLLNNSIKTEIIIKKMSDKKNINTRILITFLSFLGTIIANSYLALKRIANIVQADIKKARFPKFSGKKIRVKIGLSRIGINCENPVPEIKVAKFPIDFIGNADLKELIIKKLQLTGSNITHNFNSSFTFQ